MKLNRFYIHRDANGGHPSLIYDRDINNDRYKAVCFTSKDGKGRTKLKHSINSKTRDVSYVHNNPIESSHRHFEWRKELKECSIKKDDKPLIESIKKKK